MKEMLGKIGKILLSCAAAGAGLGIAIVLFLVTVLYGLRLFGINM
jgi:hypothetical protein